MFRFRSLLFLSRRPPYAGVDLVRRRPPDGEQLQHGGVRCSISRSPFHRPSTSTGGSTSGTEVSHADPGRWRRGRAQNRWQGTDPATSKVAAREGGLTQAWAFGPAM